MKAITFRKYGSIDVLKLEEIETPNVDAGEVLIRVSYAAVNPVDWKVRKGIARILTGFFKPKQVILGADVAGIIVEKGRDVVDFNIGDEVYAILGGIDGGGYAEYVNVSTEKIALKPKTLSLKEAAAVPLAGLTAFQALITLDLQGKKVLVNGASGGVGIFAVQIAKALGATVTGVCSQTNVELVQALGASKVIDYTMQNFTKGTTQQYDIIFDAVGTKSYRSCHSILTPTGVFFTTIPHPKHWLLSKILPLFSRKRIELIIAKSSGKDLVQLAKLIDASNLKVIIDNEFPLSNAAAAQDYSETGRVKGKLVLRVDK